MMSCITAGDSIGDGIHHYAPTCTSMAHKGWSSARWHRHYAKITLSADRVLISLGSNDGRGDTASQIAAIRKQVKARQVVWVVPACNPRAARAVEAEAARHGDALVWIRHMGPDHVHPTMREYRSLAKRSGLGREPINGLRSER